MAGYFTTLIDVKYLPNIEVNRMAWTSIKSQALMVIFQLNLKKKNRHMLETMQNVIDLNTCCS